jgi:hypothetical protein
MALSQAAPYSVAQANLELLRQRLREALYAKKARLRELMELCKAQRAELRNWIKQRREQALAELRDELRNARSAAQSTRRARLQDARRTAMSDVELARAAVEIERAHAAEHQRITRAHETKRVAIDKAHTRSLSDDTMSKAVLKRLAPLLDKAGKIRPAPGESRTEAVWRYAHAHPEEMHALLEPKTERVIAQTQKEIAATEEAIRTGAVPPLVKPMPTRPTAKRPTKPLKPAVPPRPKKTTKSRPQTAPRLVFPAPAAPNGPAKPAPVVAKEERREEIAKPTVAAVASAPPSPPPAPPAPPPSAPRFRRARAPRPRPQLGLDFGTSAVAPAEPSAPPTIAEASTPETESALKEDEPIAKGPNPYEQKKAARIERQRGRAAKLRGEAEGAHASAKAIGDMIPMGQPILVGHHSQRRHERDIGKIDKAMRKSVELTREADTLERRADKAEKSSTISSDDPEAVPKLKAKLEELNASREKMRKVNTAIRGGGDVVGKLTELGFSEKRAQELLKPDPMGRIGFPAYALQNASTEGARITARIKDLEKRAATPARPPETIGGATITEEDNRVRVAFPCVPAELVRKDLKGAGFHWSPSAGVWQRMTSNAAWSEARRILTALAQHQPPAAKSAPCP